MVSIERNFKKTALLVCDLQNVIFNMINANTNTQFIKSVKNAIEFARKMNIPIIYVKVKFREGYDDISSNNKMFSTLKNSSFSLSDEIQTEIHDSIKPHKDDIIVIKKRVSAFSGSDLEIILRSKEINNLIISGISTSGVVLSTLREAADKDYKMTVLSDCCLDFDEEVHNVLMKKVFTRQAEVLTTEEWITQ